MGGQKFEYDESGSTFFYFVLSFLALILVPATFYYWPSKRKEDPSKQAERCQCPGCLSKQAILEQSQPYRTVKNFFIKLAIISGWVLLGFLAYKVSQFDYEMSNFDPYEILGLPPGSTQSEIKKSYRKQSLILHPDKETGDEKAFMKLTKAYQALTDDEARRNWEKYGNPDGPGAMSFGIALPSWIVEKENSVWVLGLYALVFMVALPTAVGTWWYRSIRYSGEQVLLYTTQTYFYFVHKTPSMPLKRALMVLAASCEFDKRHNSEIVERVTDNEQVPALLRELPNLGEKNKEQPLCRPYSIKARALLHAHLSRMRLPPDTLEVDRRYIVGRCPDLIVEMVNCVNQLIALAYARRVQRLPTLETIENCMKLSPMIVQALWEYKSPLLQLPYINEDHLKYFSNRKKHVKSMLQLAQLKNEERRQVLRFLNDQQYDNLVRVLANMPYIKFTVNTEVIDDEDSTVVTAGAIVTVTVTLERTSLKEHFGDAPRKDKEDEDDDDDILEKKKGSNKKNKKETNNKKEINNKKESLSIKESDNQKEDELGGNKKETGGIFKAILAPLTGQSKRDSDNEKTGDQTESDAHADGSDHHDGDHKGDSQKEGDNQESEKEDGEKTVKKEVFKRPVWMKQANRRPTKARKAKPAKQAVKPPPEPATPPPAEKKKKKKLKENKKKEDDGSDSDSDSAVSSGSGSGSGSESGAEGEGSGAGAEGDDDDQWDRIQQRLNKRERLEGRTKASHPVHCPYYPQEKQEFWWCYISDRKSRTLLTAPAHVTALVDHTDLTLRFTAPRWPGLYTLTCCLRSDSYIGIDQTQEIKLDVKEAAAVPAEHPQWDLSDTDEDNNDQGGNESEFTTDDEVEE